MGITQGVHYSTATSEAGVTKCVSSSRYKPLPQHLHRSLGELVFEMPAMPKRCYIIPEPTDAYWWTDAQFIPYDDSGFYITSGAFIPRSTSAWAAVKRIPNGRLTRVNLSNSNNHSVMGLIFRESRMTNYPKIHTHPSGHYVGYLGIQAIRIENNDNEEVFNKYKDIRNCNYKFMAFSPNGDSIAVLLSVSRKFELMICRTNKGFSFDDKVVELGKLFEGFRGSTAYNEHLECKWSPDSEYIALCSSTGQMFIVDKELNPVADVFSDILTTDIFPSTAGAFDFDPRSCHEIIAVGASDRCLYVLNITSKEVTFQSEPLGKNAIDCLVYHPEGTSLAVALRDFRILFLDTSSGSITFNIDIRQTCPNVQNVSSSYASIMRLSFTTKGDHLATATCDGRMRIWQLPKQVSLFSLCRWAILCSVPPSEVKKLPLPVSLIDRLISYPYMK